MSVLFEQISAEFPLDSHTSGGSGLSFKESAAGWMGLYFDKCKFCVSLSCHSLKCWWKWKHVEQMIKVLQNLF